MKTSKKKKQQQVIETDYKTMSIAMKIIEGSIEKSKEDFLFNFLNESTGIVFSRDRETKEFIYSN